MAAAVIGGAIAGGFAGKAAAEFVDPTVEDQYWRGQHANQPYADSATDYSQYEPAYRAGYETYAEHGVGGKTFEEAEPELQSAYTARGGSMPWERAREASRAAWARLQGRGSSPSPAADPTGERNVEPPISRSSSDAALRR